MDESELLKKAAENDPGSLEQLVLKYKPLVCKIARSYFLVSGGDTDDLIQEGTIGFLKAVREYQPDKGKPFIGYAALCIHNKVRDAVRTSCRGKHLALNTALSLVYEGEEDLSELRQTDTDPFSIYINREKQQEFYNQAEKILTARQLVILKYYLQGYSYKEIADKLNITTKTVDNTLTKAKEKIKKSGIDF